MAVAGRYGITETPGGPAYRTYRAPRPVGGRYVTGPGGQRTYRAYENAPRPATSGPPAAAGGAASPTGGYGTETFDPPTLPGGTYNPEHDIISGQSAEGLTALEGRTNVSEARDRTDYFNQVGNENTDYQRASEALKKSYAQLASRQTEQQNAAGVLEGGAKLLAAQKRAENEGKQGEAAGIAHQRRLDALALQAAPPDEGNPLGGRRWQDLETGRKEARREDLATRKGQYTLAADESARAGNPGPQAARGKTNAAARKAGSKAPPRRRRA